MYNLSVQLSVRCLGSHSLQFKVSSLVGNSGLSKFTPFIQILFRALFNKALIIEPLLHASLHRIIFSPALYDVQQAGREAAVVEFCGKEDHGLPRSTLAGANIR